MHLRTSSSKKSFGSVDSSQSSISLEHPLLNHPKYYYFVDHHSAPMLDSSSSRRSEYYLIILGKRTHWLMNCFRMDSIACQRHLDDRPTASTSTDPNRVKYLRNAQHRLCLSYLHLDLWMIQLDWGRPFGVLFEKSMSQ